ncbi:MAG: class I SAM-dependent methyltransferase [Planctomycetota bacterium]
MAKQDRRKPAKKTTRKRRAKNERDTADKPVRMNAAEQILVDVASEVPVGRVVCTSTGGAHAAAAIATASPEADVHCLFLDVFLADSARRRWESLSNLQIDCEPDFETESADAFVLPLAAGGQSELARDLLQSAIGRLGLDGRLFVSTDNPKDHWLHEQLKTRFEKVTNRREKKGALYIATRPKPQKKQKSFESWFAFRDQGRLIHACSRPGVFSHRRLDLGARALIESLTIEDEGRTREVIQDGMRVLDLGCGAGTVGFAAALRGRDVRVHAVDANARAVWCAQAGAEKNQLQRFTTQLEAEGRVEPAGQFDLVLANPPYFSNFRIAEVFVQAAKTALRPHGRMHFVTKQPEWFADRFVTEFDTVSVREIRGYFVVKASQRG